MLKLSAQSAELFWLDEIVPGVRIRFRPITPVAMLVARETVGKMFDAADAAVEGDGRPSDTMQRASVALTSTLAHFGIAEWEGVGDENGEATPVTPDRIDQLLGIWPVYQAIDQRYVGPALVVSAEKNELPSAPNGTSAEAPSTAGDASS